MRRCRKRVRRDWTGDRQYMWEKPQMVRNNVPQSRTTVYSSSSTNKPDTPMHPLKEFLNLLSSCLPL